VHNLPGGDKGWGCEYVPAVEGDSEETIRSLGQRCREKRRFVKKMIRVGRGRDGRGEAMNFRVRKKGEEEGGRWVRKLGRGG